MSNFIEFIVHALILAMIGIMIGEWIMAKTNEYRAKRKIWKQFVENGLSDADARMLVQSLVAKNGQK
jgi:hypothetical protein